MECSGRAPWPAIKPPCSGQTMSMSEIRSAPRGRRVDFDHGRHAKLVSAVRRKSQVRFQLGLVHRQLYIDHTTMQSLMTRGPGQRHPSFEWLMASYFSKLAGSRCVTAAATKAPESRRRSG